MTIRALLVDDVDDVRRLVRTALRFHGGFEVVAEARDGAEAVRLAEDHHPDVVVLDLGLPDLAGREVLSQIRALSPTSKVVVYSGHDADDAWVRAHVEGYVLKDDELEYLVDLLASVGSRATRQSVLELPRALTSAALARRFVTATLTDWSLTPLIDPALLVASELAANAVTHADSAFRIQLSLTQHTLRIDVIDFGGGTPEPQSTTSADEHGRGLLLIDALTAAWGIEDGPGSGKLVWAELTLPDQHVERQSS
ncbi:response regulator [Nocardioides iriomotensis]|uniref:Response regulator n=1 Tax=Nocardioides iriomotensis TaxID=715784 RepID=A0A4Q5IY47_9ACTN|nr:response regulator [Nocardioides iriomotensis]RYU09941.1 response regulator [Nocardioides iriomotensis]